MEWRIAIWRDGAIGLLNTGHFKYI